MGSRKGRGRCFNRFKLSDLILPDRKIQLWSDDDDEEGLKTIATPTVSPRYSSDQFGNMRSAKGSPYNMSPFSQSPWVQPTSASVSLSPLPDYPATGLVGSLVREEGHVYSLATSGDLLYTGSESKNIRVWKNWREFTGFKSGSGFVKAIVVAGEKIFTGHQDGKIRVWKMSTKNPSVYKRIGTLPRLKDFLSSSFKSSNYVEARRHRNSVWIQHFDAVSCLSLDEENGVLYSGSWDRTVKVWRIADSRCLESINAHEDAVNSVAAGLGGMVFTGSADGTVKAWRKGAEGHELAGVWLRQESAVTSVVVVGDAVYCGSSDGAVNCWERGVYGGVLTGHRMAVLCLAAGGGVLASGSADGSICVWARREGGDHTKVAVLTGHSGPVKCVAVEEDPEAGGAAEGRWVVFSGSLDLSVKIWRVSEAAPSHVAEKSSWVGGEEEQSSMGSRLGQVAEILMESMAECDHHPHPTTNE